MNRAGLIGYIRSDCAKEQFLSQISAEVETYSQCSKKLGSSCHILMEGEGSFLLEPDDMTTLVKRLCEGELSPGSLDYILTGMLLDDAMIKDELTENMLESLCSVLEEGAGEGICQKLLDEVSDL